MRFNIKPDTLSYPELQEKLQIKFPAYNFKMRGKQFLVASESKTIGANIAIRKKNYLLQVISLLLVALYFLHYY